MRDKVDGTNKQFLLILLQFVFILASTAAVFSTFSSIILNARPISDDYGHITHFSKVGMLSYAHGFYMGIDSHPLSVLISTLANLVLSSIGLVPGYAMLVIVQTLLFLFLTSFLLSHSVEFGQKGRSRFILPYIATLLLILTLNFSGSSTQSSYRAYGLIGWVNFFWQHVPLNLLQVSLFLRWRKNLWLQKDTISYMLVFLLVIWGPLESLTTLGLFVFITLAQLKNNGFAIFKTNNSQFYITFIILSAAAIFTFFSPSSAGRRRQYSNEVRIGHWYERFIAYNVLSFREIFVYGIFAALISGVIGFALGFKKLLSANKLSFSNLIKCLISLMICINFVETFSYFAPFHHTIFSFVFVLSVFVGGVELGMKSPRLNWGVQAFIIFALFLSIIALYSPASSKASNYRQNWDTSQVLILSECSNQIHVAGVSGFLPGSSMNPDWNSWSCDNRNWFNGISKPARLVNRIHSNSMAIKLNSAFDNSLNRIMKLIYGGHSGNSKIRDKFDYYSY